MGTGFLRCSPSISPHRPHTDRSSHAPALSILHPAHGSISQGSASTWISVLQAQKALGRGSPGTHRAPAATSHHPAPGGHNAPAHRCTGTAPSLPPHHSVQSRAPAALTGLQEGPSGSFVKTSTMQ